MKKIDLTGKRFGDLFVVEDKDSYSRRYVLCRCECGRYKKILASELRKGTVKSCGCYRRRRLFKSVMWNKFNRLFVISEEVRGKRRKAVVRCDCGNVLSVMVEHLVNGHTKSCGCLQREATRKFQNDLTGRKFSNLVVLSDLNYGTNRKVSVQCDCGTQFETQASSLTGGNTRSCGCIAKKYKGFARYDTFASQIKYADKVRRSIVDDVILEAECTYCGQWFIPSVQSVQNRIAALSGMQSGEQRLYCSEYCKTSCPIYNQTKYMRGYEMATPREVDPYLRKFVLNRDGYVCQMCYCGMCDKPLHVHHINGVRKVPVMANDPDNCITLCVDCHENIHSVIGCRKVDYQCK